jgi:glucosamine--fructose-6-phosphate aminotransferase (isomerizing)
MAAEMAEQPAVLARLVERWDDGLASIRAAAPDPRDLRGVILVARGSSDHAATFGRYAIEAAARVPVSLVAPSLITRYGVEPRVRDWLVVAASQSGGTPEVVSVTEHLGRLGACTLAITNDPSSPLGLAADAVVALDTGPEEAVPATKTVTAEFGAFAMVAEALGPVPWTREELVRLPTQVEQVLEDPEPVPATVGRIEGADTAVVVARGYLYGSAQEVALKLKEAALIGAEASPAPDLLHGPIAAVRSDVPVIALSATGPTRDDVVALVETLRHRTRVILVGDEPEADLPIPRSAEPLAAISAVVRGQQLALVLALRRGLDPDRPPGLSKVTRTR